MNELCIPLPDVNDLTKGMKHGMGKFLCSLAKSLRRAADYIDAAGSALIEESVGNQSRHLKIKTK